MIKICDFGLARPLFENFCNNADLTEYIATRWYRPPEVLLGWDKYDKSIDIWSIGCIFAEILGRRPLFPGHETTEQIELIVQVLGTPKIETIYKDGRTNSREQIFKFGEIEKTDFKEMFPDASLEAIDLLEKMLRFDPDKRITIDEAIRHKYFNDLPLEPGEKPEKVGEYDFEFEKFELNLTELRELILYESLLYHDEKIFEEYLKKREKFNSAKEKLRRLESENPKTSLSDSISTNKNSIKSNGKSYKDITKHVKKK